MKKTIRSGAAVLLILVMLAASVPVTQFTSFAKAAAAKVVDDGFFGSENEFTWSFYTDGTLCIDGNGEMPDFEDEKTPWALYGDYITGAVISEGITSVGAEAFYMLTNLASVSLPSSLKKIGTGAFVCCSSLKEIELPDGLEEIKAGAFEYCTSIQKINFPKSLKNIEGYAFGFLISLKELVWPGSADTNVDQTAFSVLPGIETLVIPEDAINADDQDSDGSALYYALSDSYMLKNVYNYSENITVADKCRFFSNEVTAEQASAVITRFIAHYSNNILDETFDFAPDCDKFMDICEELHDEISNQYGVCSAWFEIKELIYDVYVNDTDRGASPFTKIHCKPSSEEHTFCRQNNIVHYVMTEQETYEICYCNSYGNFENGGKWELDFESETLKLWLAENSDTDTNFNHYAEYIKNVEIYPASDSVERMNINGIFRGLYNLEELVLPEGVNKISYSEFSGSGIKKLYLPSTASFSGERNNMASLEYIEVNQNNETLVSRNGALYSRDGVLIKMPEASYDGTYLPGVNEVDSYAFENYRTVTKIALPDSAKKIDSMAIVNCPSVTEIEIGSETEKIESDFIWNGVCNLQNIFVADDNNSFSSRDGVLCTKDGEYLRRYPMGRSYAAIPDSVEYIENLSFYRCERITAISIPDGIKEIRGNAFWECGRLKTVTFSENSGLQFIGKSPFARSGLQQIIIPNGVSKFPNSLLDIAPIKNIICRNPDMDFSDARIKSDITLHGYANSSAEKYAAENGNNFITLSDCSNGHVFGEWKTVSAAKCDTDGKRTRFCNSCFETETEEIPAFGHTMHTTKHTKPSCGTNGWTINVCGTCGMFVCDDLPSQHDFVDKTVAATCTEQGYTVHNCSVCGYSYTDGYTDPAGHKYVAKTVPATCEESGFTSYVCSVCGNTYKDNITEPLGHRDDNGDGKCDVCGTSLSPEKCTHLCHSSSKFVRFFWKIICFFNKLFRTNQYCSCGAKHW